jgi:hypothetical protein
LNTTKFNSWSIHYRWAFFLSLAGAIIAGLVIWFVFAFAQGRITEAVGWLFVMFPLMSVAIAFKWPVAGGILLILESLPLIGLVIMAIPAQIIIQSSFQTTGSTLWWMVLIPLVAGLCLLASGILYLSSYRRNGGRNIEGTDKERAKGE